jgi:hypothetical protein
MVTFFLNHALWIVPAIILSAGIALVVAARFRRAWWVVLPPVALLTVWAILGPGFLAYTFGGGFGPGTMLSMLSIPLDCFSSIVIAVGGISILLKERKGRWKRDTAIYVVCALVILALPVVPVAGGRAIRNRCDRWNREAAETILPALEAYKGDEGVYPESPEQLVPEYVDALPTLRCFENRLKYGMSESPLGVEETHKLEVVRCSDTVTLLVAPDLAGGWPQRYNLTTGRWSKISFLDGVCSFLE